MGTVIRFTAFLLGFQFVPAQAQQTRPVDSTEFFANGAWGIFTDWFQEPRLGGAIPSVVTHN